MAEPSLKFSSRKFLFEFFRDYVRPDQYPLLDWTVWVEDQKVAMTFSGVIRELDKDSLTITIELVTDDYLEDTGTRKTFSVDDVVEVRYW